jgi:hypothetical protein
MEKIAIEYLLGVRRKQLQGKCRSKRIKLEKKGEIEKELQLVDTLLLNLI